jgi:hypothetical protein
MRMRIRFTACRYIFGFFALIVIDEIVCFIIDASADKARRGPLAHEAVPLERQRCRFCASLRHDRLLTVSIGASRCVGFAQSLQWPNQ